ncbi:hypothetical protein FRC15_005829 [Serendipita sp. 397]|nr:hypothetical protein FRC15_005829 [Serendipita sp. 397]
MSQGKTAWVPGRYPPARRGDHVDVYKSAKQGEVKVHDPYQWLETSSEETSTWIQDQVEFTNEYFNRISDRNRLKDLMMENVDFAKFSAPSRKGDKRWYWYYNSGLQPQSVLYRSIDENLPDFSKTEGAGGEVFFDPNLLSDDGTAAIATTAFSEDGEYFAYGISLSGSDFFTAYVRKTSVPYRAIDGKRPDVDEGIVDTLRYIKFSSLEWTLDNKGIFYQRFPDRESHDISQNPPVFKDVIPEDPEATLVSASLVGGHLVVVYSRNVQDELYLYTKSGEKLRRLAEEFVGSIVATAREKETWFFVTTTGFTTPGIIYRYDFNAPEDARWTTHREVKIKGIKADDFLVHQEWYTGKDGTRIPMFIVRPKDIKKDGTASALQYGYGGFSYSVGPAFSATILTYIKAYGAIYVVANIRGGSEFGEEWHLAGTRERKVNVFDDFIAATEHLTKTGWVAPGKVAINGASNGGLLIAACLNRAPQGTFGAGVADVGVLDMLKFADFTIGRAWTSDYGDPHVAEDFDFIYPISPLHNIPDQELPPTLLLTADHDDRVVPLHTFKHTAALQHKLANNTHPLLVRIETSAGHGAGKSTEKKVSEAADKWSFVAYSLGLQWREEGTQEGKSKRDEL